MSRCIGVIYLGVCRYRHALQIQESIAQRIKQKQDPSLNGVLLILQHPPVYTYGIRREAINEFDAEKLQQLGADVEYAGRGGLVTFHGPGQLVAWPVLDLKSFSGIRKHIYNLEESIIETCKKLRLNDVERNKEYPGVWRSDGKLCAVGVRASHYITTHGLALNVSTDLSWFDHIIPCGIQDKRVTSLCEELKRNITVEEVIPVYLKSFSKIFNSELIAIQDKYDIAVANR